MKRREMIQYLDNFLSKYDLDIGDQLLNFIEEMGMAPPEIRILEDSYNRSEGTHGFYVNEWEPEDE